VSKAATILGTLLVAAGGGCAHRTVTVVTNPPGGLVTIYPRGETTVSPAALDLRASKPYTVKATLKGYDVTYGQVPSAGGSWFAPWPINVIAAERGEYDSIVTLELHPCSTPDGCLEAERTRLQRRTGRDPANP